MPEDRERSFQKAAEEIEAYGQEAVWRSDGSFAVIDNGVHSGEHVVRSWQVPKTTAAFLRSLAECLKPKIILELGTSIGYSTVWLARGAEEAGGHVYTVEHFPYKAKRAEKHFLLAGVDVTLFAKEISDVLAGWTRGEIDLVFMDADRGKYRQYLSQILPLLSAGGVIVVDNAANLAHKQHLRDFMAMVESDPSLVRHFHPLDNGLLFIARRGVSLAGLVQCIHD